MGHADALLFAVELEMLPVVAFEDEEPGVKVW